MYYPLAQQELEGYRVSPELIEKVRVGNWKPEEEDKEHKNALVARGYYQAFQAVGIGHVKRIEKTSLGRHADGRLLAETFPVGLYEMCIRDRDGTS